MKYNLIVILLERDVQNVDNVLEMKKRFPDLTIMKAVDWKLHYDLVEKFIKKYNISAPLWGDPNYPHRNKGKFSRWTSLILTMKYVYDLKLENVILIEDDVMLPINFNKIYQDMLTLLDNFDKFDFVKLSKWGEGYLFNYKGAKKFIEMLYKYGICNHDDNFINKYVADITEHIITERHLIRLPNEGHIWDTPPTKFVNVGEDKPKILLDEKIFDDSVDIDLPIFLNNLVN